MEGVDDNALLQRARNGDVPAFERLVERHRDHVYALALRMMRSEADAAEITQDVFLSAYRNLHEFRGEAQVGSWLRRIAANRALMRLRHKKVAAEVEQPHGPEFNDRGSLIDDVADWRPNALTQTLDAELAQAIQLATDELPEEHRQVFLLKDLEGLSYEEIADLTGESVPAIKSRLHRARLGMRAAIHRFFQDVG